MKRNENPRILVVDDEVVICEILSDFLTESGFDVKTAHNGDEALEILKKKQFHMMITDLKMPKMDGLELLDEARKVHKDMVMIVMTGYGTVESAIDAMKKGAYDYILKPFRIEEVLHIVKRGIEQYELKKQNIHLKEALKIYEVSEKMTPDKPIKEIIKNILDVLTKEPEFEAISLFLKDRQGIKYSKVISKSTYEDIEPPGIDQVNFEAIEELFQKDQPVLFHHEECKTFFKNYHKQKMMNSFISVPLIIKDKIIGMLNVYSFSKSNLFREGQRKMLSVVAGRIAASIENARLYEDMQKTFRQAIQALCIALEAKHPYTRGHSQRVAIYSKLIAEAMGMSEDEIDTVYNAALLHDIGKIGIRQEELDKPGSLTEKEYKMFKEHVVISKKILEPLAFLKDLIPGAYYHHERMDGRGYPEGLKGEEIPLMSRIIMVTDAYDAMTSDRAYRKALKHKKAIEELKKNAGTQFDPEVVDIFVKVIEEYRKKQKEDGKEVPP